MTREMTICLMAGAVIGAGMVLLPSDGPAPKPDPGAATAVSSIPSYDVDATCRKANDGTHDYDYVAECISQEQGSFDTLKQEWPRTDPGIREDCLGQVTAPRWKYYTQLDLCRQRVTNDRYAEAHPPHKPTPPTFKR